VAQPLDYESRRKRRPARRGSHQPARLIDGLPLGLTVTAIFAAASFVIVPAVNINVGSVCFGVALTGVCGIAATFLGAYLRRGGS
jgi:hypothetical protein